MSVDLRLGDSREVLKTLPDNSVDSIVCDPPYALVSITKRFGKDGAAPAQFSTDGVYTRASSGFMGKDWDTGELPLTLRSGRKCCALQSLGRILPPLAELDPPTDLPARLKMQDGKSVTVSDTALCSRLRRIWLTVTAQASLKATMCRKRLKSI